MPRMWTNRYSTKCYFQWLGELATDWTLASNFLSDKWNQYLNKWNLTKWKIEKSCDNETSKGNFERKQISLGFTIKKQDGWRISKWWCVTSSWKSFGLFWRGNLRHYPYTKGGTGIERNFQSIEKMQSVEMQIQEKNNKLSTARVSFDALVEEFLTCRVFKAGMGKSLTPDSKIVHFAVFESALVKMENAESNLLTLQKSEILRDFKRASPSQPKTTKITTERWSMGPQGS